MAVGYYRHGVNHNFIAIATTLSRNYEVDFSDLLQSETLFIAQRGTRLYGFVTYTATDTAFPSAYGGNEPSLTAWQAV